MIKQKFVFPVAVFAGVIHLFLWLTVTNVWYALAASLAYALVVYVTYLWRSEKGGRK